MAIFKLFVFGLISTAAASFTVYLREQRADNEVSLRCRDSDNGGNEIPGAFFFLGDARLDQLVPVGRAGTEIRFILRRDLEGDYSCSDNLEGERSDPIQLVGESKS